MRNTWWVGMVTALVAVACGSQTEVATSSPTTAGSGGSGGTAPPSCTDSVKNGDETDVDCGGSSCSPCADGNDCADAADCQSGVCDGMKCVPATCMDSIQNGDETDVDCGGKCSPCADGKGCTDPSDCQSGVCDGMMCAAPTCMDNVKNGDETDVDCGGPVCNACTDGKACVAPSDCQSGVCDGMMCAAPTCMDNVKNGDETDVDCGGSSCGGCSNTKACAAPSDCLSNVCTNMACAPCKKLDDCPNANNCVQGICETALASCSLLNQQYGLGDGEYWINPNNQPVRAYCDMQLKKALCTEVQAARTGKMRDTSKLAYKMTSILDHANGVCELWAIRGNNDYPFGGLSTVAGNTLSACLAMGFLGTGSIDGCQFGSDNPGKDCGYPISTLYRYGNNCGGCTLNNGQFNGYVLQGPMFTAGVLSTFDGTKRARCKIR